MVILTSAAAHAQETAGYDALVDEGLAEFEARRWVEAYNLFKSAHALSPNARTLRGMGMTSYELAEYPRALRELRAALDSTDKPLDAAMQSHVQGLIERATRLVGTLDISVDPPGAQVFVNRELRERGPVVVSVGKATVRAESEGYAPLERVVTVDGGRRYPVDITLQPIAAQLAPATAVKEIPRTHTVVGPPPRDAEPADDTDGDSSAWIWVSVGAAVVTGVVAGLVLAADDTKPGESFPEGNVGLTFHALGAR